MLQDPADTKGQDMMQKLEQRLLKLAGRLESEACVTADDGSGGAQDVCEDLRARYILVRD